MRLEHYPAKKLGKEFMDILRKHLDIASYRVFFFGSRITGRGTDRAERIPTALPLFRKLADALRVNAAEQ